MLKLQTPVTDQECKVGISYKDKIMMLGSCFSDAVGKQLADYGFDVCVNPFGTLYNPVSILQSLEMLAGERMFGPEDCVQIGAGDERWCSFSHHTSFARSSREEFLANANDSLAAAREYFAGCTKVIITLGTAWCFRNVESGVIVSNCLKRPAKEFVRERLSPSDVTAALGRIARLCAASAGTQCQTDGQGQQEGHFQKDRQNLQDGQNLLVGQNLQVGQNQQDGQRQQKDIIFTVSPIRHFKDGAHGNQISKASLLVGVDDFLNTLPTQSPEQTQVAGQCGVAGQIQVQTGSSELFRIPGQLGASGQSGVPGQCGVAGQIQVPVVRADYFPAYEIVMDELRDYRFYAEDMCHPSAQAVDYIRERFLTWALPASEHPTLQENIRTFKHNSHRRL